MQLFLDMDGVLADLAGTYERRFGTRLDTHSDNIDWERVRNTPGFFESLDPMPDLYDLWDAVRHLNPIVLTGLPRTLPEEARANKRAWLNRWLGWDVPMIGCLSADKCLHGKPGDILVDDWERYRLSWLHMGGHWVTHTSAADSIAQLKKLGALDDMVRGRPARRAAGDESL